MTIRASYKYGVEWIAVNDEPDEIDQGTVSEMISIMLLADLFGKPYFQVAADVIKYRAKHAKG